MSYTEAKKAYEALEINVEAALEKLKTAPVSLHCWQGDDVRGFDTDPAKPLTGGIQTTGNYPGRARTPQELMADIEIVVDRIADMRIQDMNTVLEVACQKVMKEYAPDEMDVYMRTLEVAQINETDYFSYIIHEDMDEITETIRENHRKDTTTADETTPTQDGIKVLMHSILDQKDETTVLLKQLCAQMQIPEEKITEEEVRAFRSMLQKSRLFKKQMSMRGKGGHANKRR